MGELRTDLKMQRCDHGPGTRVGRGFILAMALSLLGVWLAVFAPIQVLLAQQMEILAPNSKESALGMVMGIGSAIALVAQPVIGFLSDRTRSVFGRRHPWNFLGIVVGALALYMLGKQTTWTGIVVYWALVQVGTSGVLCAITAAIPDRVPVEQRAIVSAWNGVMLSVAVVLGAVITTTLGVGIAQSYTVVAAIFVVLSMPFVLFTDDPLGQQVHTGEWRWKAFFSAFWISPRKHPDFAWAWSTRFLVGLSSATGTLFFLYFLRDGLRYEALYPGERAEDGLLKLVLIYTAAVVVTAFACGAISDRTGRRKAIVTVSGMIMGVASLLLAFWQNWPMAMVSSAVLGVGYGAYVAVDQALISQVLPSSADHAKDLGIINVAIVGPQILAPALCAMLVTQFGGYPALSMFAGLAGLMGGLLVLKIKSVP